MTREFGFGLIGCGGISRVHVEEISRIKGAKLVAVSDVSATRARTVGERTGVDWYTDYHEMLGRNDIDIINVATPTGTHAEIVVDAARAGKHVIVEKPIDTAISKAEWAITECRNAGVKLCVVSQHRFDDSTICLKEALRDGRFGNLVLGQATVHWYRSQAYFDRSAGCGTWAMDGGGVLMIQALHSLDILQYLMGPVSTVHAYTKTATHPGIEVEDVAVATVTFDNGAMASVSATTSAFPRNSTRIEIIGEFGTAVVEDDKLRYLYFRDRDEPGPIAGGYAFNWAAPAKRRAFLSTFLHHISNRLGLRYKARELAHRRQFRDMIDAIAFNREPLVNGEEGLNVLKLIVAMYDSAKTGETISLRNWVTHS